jgi:hypothetical protein
MVTINGLGVSANTQVLDALKQSIATTRNHLIEAYDTEREKSESTVVRRLGK